MEEAEPIEGELVAHEATLAELAHADRCGRGGPARRADRARRRDRPGGIRARQLRRPPCPMSCSPTYEPLRAGLGGVAVARLHGARCEGCHLEIPSAELEEVRRAPADSLVSCPECMRILVR